MNSEKTTICRISLVAIASIIDAGTMWVTKVARLKPAVSTPAVAPAVGSGRFTPTPGWSSVTSTSPSDNETKLAAMNQPIARPPTRPSSRVSPICATPDTRVANTSGAMIILMSRKNTVVRMVK